MTVIRAIQAKIFLVFFILLQAYSCNDEKNIDVDASTSLCESNAEICNDEIDNNCDGNIDIYDSSCECQPDEINRRCWPDVDIAIVDVLANPNLGLGSRLNGRCKYGSQICRALPMGGSEWGNWNRGFDNIGGTEDDIWMARSCIGAYTPEEEVCDNVDNDCDGRTDESLKIQCWSGAINQDGDPAPWIRFYNATTSPDSICKQGIKTCEQGHWSACLHEVLPQSEICDGIDNNCDGDIDNSILEANDLCGLTDFGICEYGNLQCQTDVGDMVCQDYINPREESCNLLDDDCDGVTDEELYRPCETICNSGFETCIAGIYQRCTAQQPVEEQCDGIDNDCDGSIDEELHCICPPELEGALIPCLGGALECGMGFKTCMRQGDTLSITDCCILESFLQQGNFQCLSGEGQIVDEECNNYDDDCDGSIDEDLLGECYTGPAETRGVGECIGGEVICIEGRWGNFSNEIFISNLCAGQVLPREEFCNDRDDDCDGRTDEDLNTHDNVDIVFVLDQSGSMCPYVRALTQGFTSYVMDFIGTNHKFAIVNIGTMNNQDNTWLEILLNFSDAQTAAQRLAMWTCMNFGIEPTYDAIHDIGSGTTALSFRDNAFPIVIIMTDELAQSIKVPTLQAADVRAVLSPCAVGDCGQVDKLEVYSIVPQIFIPEWCEPADIAKRCYDLYNNIDGETIRQYLDDIFIEVCR
jgi:hypothetical protein